MHFGDSLAFIRDNIPEGFLLFVQTTAFFTLVTLTIDIA